MDFNNFDFNDFFNYIQNNCNSSNNNYKYNNENSSSDTQQCKDNLNCNDIPGGFQDLAPGLFPLLAQIVGIVISGNLPFNLQNAIGNWFELLGQIILTFNSQQQYFQSGPGRYYNPMYKNVSNPFCQTSTTESTTNESNDHTNPSSMNSNNNKSSSIYEKEIKELKNSIEELKKEINKLKNNK
ncbi:DUF4200 domain-containing protein [Clostridium taeniosporum]|uniref:Uncharacterized protein n=1 Tax=Clostridium taeniosporum TaxID=394958 RepID=A0A1D7XLP4_9CLOT|nr:DUF4200 domain-containing protein [Clostridium taeniosporum]AOR24283.1 hypothetical protein BGI42_11290 [Clostridium taeniosporum]